MSFNRAYSMLKDTLQQSKDSMTNYWFSTKASEAQPAPAITNNSNRSFYTAKLLAIPMTLLSYIPLVSSRATSTYVNDIASNTQYKLDYDTEDFKHLTHRLLQSCNVNFPSSSNAIFTALSTAQCDKNGVITGPNIGINIQTGKMMAENFRECLAQAIKLMCVDHAKEPQSSSSDPDHTGEVAGTAVALIAFILIMVAIFSCMQKRSARQFNANMHAALDSSNVPPPPYSRINDSRIYTTPSEAKTYTPPPAFNPQASTSSSPVVELNTIHIHNENSLTTTAASAILDLGVFAAISSIATSNDKKSTAPSSKQNIGVTFTSPKSSSRSDDIIGVTFSKPQ